MAEVYREPLNGALAYAPPYTRQKPSAFARTPHSLRRFQVTQRTTRSVTRGAWQGDVQLALVARQTQSKATRAPRATKLVRTPPPARITAAICHAADDRACAPPDRCDHDPTRPRGPEELRYKPNGEFQRMLVETGSGWEPRMGMAAPCHPSDYTAAWLVPIRKRRYFGGNHHRMYARVEEHEVRVLDAPGPGHPKSVAVRHRAQRVPGIGSKGFESRSAGHASSSRTLG